MTVDQLIAELQKLSAEGKGGAQCVTEQCERIAHVEAVLAGSMGKDPVYEVFIAREQP